MDTIPPELLHMILSNLGIIAYLEMRTVCRYFCDALPPKLPLNKWLILGDPDLHLYPDYRSKIGRTGAAMLESVSDGNLENMKWLMWGSDYNRDDVKESGFIHDGFHHYKSNVESDSDSDSDSDSSSSSSSIDNNNQGWTVECVAVDQEADDSDEDPPLKDGYPWDERTFRVAAREGNFEIMEWLYERGCPFTGVGQRGFCGAALNGNLENMKWMKARDDTWDEQIFQSAAMNGNLENMKWLRNPTWLDLKGELRTGKPCPWNGWALKAAVEYGNLDNLKWLFNPTDCGDSQANRDGCHIKVGDFCYVSKIFSKAVEKGRHEIVEWLLSVGIFDASAFGIAYQQKDRKLMKMIADYAMNKTW